MRLLVDAHLRLWAAAKSRRLPKEARRLLEDIHKDPFDRMLVAQSLAEPLVLLTNDGLLADYGDVVKVV